MSKYVLLVQSNAVAGKDDEYNQWYDEIHLKEVLALEGFHAAQRFAVRGDPVIGAASHKYVALYELATDDPQASLDALGKAVGEGEMAMSDAIDLRSVSAVLIEPITGRVLAGSGS